MLPRYFWGSASSDGMEAIFRGEPRGKERSLITSGLVTASGPEFPQEIFSVQDALRQPVAARLHIGLDLHGRVLLIKIPYT